MYVCVHVHARVQHIFSDGMDASSVVIRQTGMTLIHNMHLKCSVKNTFVQVLTFTPSTVH